MWIHRISLRIELDFAVPRGTHGDVGDANVYAAFSTLIADSVSGSERDRWYGLVGISQTIGSSLSGVIASLLIGSAGLGGFRVIVGANACCLLLSAFLMHESTSRRQIGRQGGDGMTILQVLRDRRYMLLVAANGLFMLCSMLVGLGFALYATDALGAPLWVVAATGIAGAALLIGLQTRITDAARVYRRTSVMMFAGGLWVIACVLLAGAVAIPKSLVVPYLSIATLVFTLSQLFYIPASRALAASLSPLEGRGRYIAMFELSYGVAAAAGPALFGLLYDVTPAAPWVVMAGVVSAATVMLARIQLRVAANQNYPLAGLQH